MANLVTTQGCRWVSLCIQSLHNDKPHGRILRVPPMKEMQLSESSLIFRRTLHLRNERKPVAVRAEHQKETEEEWDYQTYQALLRGGEDVADVMRNMTELLEDISGIDAETEGAAVEIAAAGAVGQHLEKLDGSFLLALDWMIRQADSDHDDKRKGILEVIKDTVLAQLTEKCPAHVQVVGMLCRTPKKENRQEILRRVAGGGGIFDTENGGKLSLPKANLNNIATQADNLLMNMEEKPRVQDRRLLARLVLVREEARSMMGGGLLDKRNDNRGLKNLPEPVVNFLAKIVSLRPGPALRERISSVMHGKEEGKDLPVEDEFHKDGRTASHNKQQGQVSRGGTRGLPVRPGIFLDAVTKVIGGMYETHTAGVNVQQLEWIHRETLNILQEMAFS